MADSVISDAIPGIQDEGLPGISDGSEDWGSAGLRMMLAQAVDSDSYVRSDSELTFTNHNGTNDTVDVTGGVAYLDLTGETVDVQSSFGGSSPPAYDTTLPTLPAIPVIVPTTVTGVSLQDSTLSSVWLAYDTDGTGPGSAGSVYIRSDDTGSVTAPSHPNVELGQANPDNASADSLGPRFGSPTFDAVTSDSVDTEEVTNSGAVNVSTTLTQNFDRTGSGDVRLGPAPNEGEVASIVINNLGTDDPALKIYGNNVSPILELDNAGNVTIAGSLTENTTP